MRALPVVVLGVDAERVVELSSTKDECPVEALGPDRLDHALGVGIGVRSLDGRHDHPGPWGSETAIRSRGEAVVLVNESAEQVPPANVARTDRDRVSSPGQW